MTVGAAGALLLALVLSLVVFAVALRLSRRIGAPLLPSADRSDRLLSTVGILACCGPGGQHAYHLVEPDALRCVLCGAAGPDPLGLLHDLAPRVGVTESRTIALSSEHVRRLPRAMPDRSRRDV
jgi:hypothetical protein